MIDSLHFRGTANCIDIQIPVIRTPLGADCRVGLQTVTDDEVMLCSLFQIYAVSRIVDRCPDIRSAPTACYSKGKDYVLLFGQGLAVDAVCWGSVS